MPPLHILSNHPTIYQKHVDEWYGCTACALSTTRRHMCFARGDIPCEVCFLGEAPGKGENVLGRPFVGDAGRMMQSMIDEAWEVRPHTTYNLTNLVCCMPPQDKNGKQEPPRHEEILACAPRLQEFIHITDPVVIVCVGKLAMDYLDPEYKHCIGFHRAIQCYHIRHPGAILKADISQRLLMYQKNVIALEEMLAELDEIKSNL